MKRTIEEVMNLLEQKKQNAINEIERIIPPRCSGKTLTAMMQRQRILGEIDAYTDVICLIASSHLLEGEEK